MSYIRSTRPGREILERLSEDMRQPQSWCTQFRCNWIYYYVRRYGTSEYWKTEFRRFSPAMRAIAETSYKEK